MVKKGIIEEVEMIGELFGRQIEQTMVRMHYRRPAVTAEVYFNASNNLQYG